MGAKRDSCSDNTDSDSSSSEDEEEDEAEGQKRPPKKGKVIKESFLLRKVMTYALYGKIVSFTVL